MARVSTLIVSIVKDGPLIRITWVLMDGFTRIGKNRMADYLDKDRKEFIGESIIGSREQFNLMCVHKCITQCIQQCNIKKVQSFDIHSSDGGESACIYTVALMV